MKVLSAEFVKSCVRPDQYPRAHLPEVAFVGRSNVGKSSAINSLVHRKGMAKISTVPGKTQTLNFFRVTTTDRLCPALVFVDLPGYGYARAARSVREQWGPMIERYLTARPQLFVVVQLVDVRVIEERDVTTLAWLTHMGHRPIVVGTKLDKLSRGQRRPGLIRLCQRLGLGEQEDTVGYSSRTNEGRQELWQIVKRRYEQWRQGVGAEEQDDEGRAPVMPAEAGIRG